MRTLLLLCFLFSVACFGAAEIQKMAEIKTPLLKEKLNILLDPEVIHIQEEKNKITGVIVHAKGIFKKINLKRQPGDMGFVSNWEKHRVREYVLIEDLDVEDLSSGAVISHKPIGVGQRGLWVWYIGTQKVRMKYLRKGKPMWLKKYTVDPQKAETYYKNKAANK